MNKATSQALDFASTKAHQLFIGGRWQDASHGETFEVLDPGTGKLLARVASGTAEDVDCAVAAGQEAFVHSGWATMPAKDRAAILTCLADLIDANADVLAAIESMDGGKQTMTGRELMEEGLEVGLKTQPSAALFAYQRLP